ncbi:uncharacterized protein LOC62_02G001844 [Vanrija pseudolonga]|uniref:CND01770-like protein n=1 Tax=Vanrija pseudolonga TaxID=143232 RepID=A0AAF0Y571_9TREE|nr:hypothetical protein LOC62_02G001844 [Vanrija pseudolonga]
MYIPDVQKALVAALGIAGALKPSKVASGSVLDYAVESCLDDDGNVRCSKPFLVTKSTCYKLKWHTEGAISHTTVEVRDAGSNEIVYYRDTDGEWTPEKGELVYLDFKPKIPGQGNNTVDYTVKTCE